MEVLGQLHGHAVALRLPIKVINIGSGGFSIETPVPFPDRSPQDFRFTAPDDVEVVLTAMSVRSARLDRPHELPVYVTGFEFAITSDGEQKALDALVETMAAMAR